MRLASEPKVEPWRPLIHLNFAVDEEGRFAGAPGRPAILSCATDWRRVHGLREHYDAVAVGGRTWNLDRPQLTARAEKLGREPRQQPRRVVFAGSNPVKPPRAGAPLFLISALDCKIDETTVIRCLGRQLNEPLQCLHSAGIRSMLVEGGPTLIESFLQQGYADRITIFARARDERSAAAAIRAVLPEIDLLPSRAKLGEGWLFNGAPVSAVAELQACAAHATGVA